MEKKDKICCSFNFAPHYREDIYLLMDKELNCEFYFGNRTYAKIKKMDYSKFISPLEELKFKEFFYNFYFLQGQSKLASKKYKYYLISGQPYNISAWLLIIKNKMYGNKTFIWNHGLYGKESIIKKLIMKLQSQMIDGYFLYGNFAKELMIKNGFNENKLHVIYNSLNYFKTSLLRSKLIKTKIFNNHFQNVFPNIIFIGRLTKIKKLDLLLEAQKKSFKKNIKYNITLIGDGSEKNSLEKLIKDNDLNKHVWVYGSCYDEEKIAELIYNADLCVSPGNIGLTAIHSLSYGTPAVTHNNFIRQMPEFEALKEGLTGSFFKENDYESLAQTIESWLLKFPIKNIKTINDCFKVIDEYYNPTYQINLLKKELN